MKRILSLCLVIYILSIPAICQEKNNSKSQNSMEIGKNVLSVDTYKTNESDLLVKLIGHASVMFEYEGKVIYVDPYSNVADYSRYPKADLIIITHEHADHLDEAAINLLKADSTHFIVSQICNEILGYGDIMKNGDKTAFNGIPIEAVPAYNKVHKKANGDYYHPKGRGNGYIFTFGGLRVYIAGDTENINEMKRLKGTIDIAFLPKNLPYTMDDTMFIDAAKMIQPKYLYPYHLSEINKEEITKALNGTDIKLEFRPMSSK